MGIEAVVFDLGGVVVKNSELGSVKAALEIDPERRWEIIRIIASDVQTGRVSEEELLRYLREVTGLSKIPQDLFERRYRENFGLVDGTIDIIKNLRELGTSIAALSNTIPSHVRVIRENGVFDLFDVEVLSCEEGARKPDPQIYQTAIDRLGVSPGEVFYTDDSPKFVAAAREIGIEAVVFQNSDQLRSELKDVGLVV
jgi:putative hydrolase of the HAD superfamily